MTDHILDLVLTFRGEPYQAPRATRPLDDETPPLEVVRRSRVTADVWRVLSTLRQCGATTRADLLYTLSNSGKLPHTRSAAALAECMRSRFVDTETTRMQAARTHRRVIYRCTVELHDDI